MASDAALSVELDATLSRDAPAVSEAVAEELCRQLYGLSAAARLFSGERDANFRIEGEDGRRFFLKIVHPDEDASVSSMHTAALAHVQERAPHLGLQAIVPCLDGRLDARIEAGGRWRTARLTGEVRGVSQNETATTRAQVRAAGVALAELQYALREFRHRAEDHASTWDMTRAPNLASALDAFEDEDERAELSAILERFESEIGPRLPDLSRQMAHNDFNRDNILVDPDEPDRITGIIDVGDMTRTPILCDLAIALAYQLGEENDPLESALPLLEGFASRQSIDEGTVRLLPTAIRTRMAMRLIVPQWRARRFPGRADFILRNSPRVRSQLRAWALFPLGEAEERLMAASRCGAETGATP